MLFLLFPLMVPPHFRLVSSFLPACPPSSFFHTCPHNVYVPLFALVFYGAHRLLGGGGVLLHGLVKPLLALVAVVVVALFVALSVGCIVGWGWALLGLVIVFSGKHVQSATMTLVPLSCATPCTFYVF